MTNNENERTLATIEVEIESSRLETKAFNAPCHVLTALETKWPDPKPITIRAWDEEARRQALTLEVGAITDLIVELNPTTQGGYYRNLVIANANQLNQEDQQAYIAAYPERNKQRGGSSTAPAKAKATPAPTPAPQTPRAIDGAEVGNSKTNVSNFIGTYLTLYKEWPSEDDVERFALLVNTGSRAMVSNQRSEKNPEAESQSGDTLNEEDLGLF